MRTLNPREEAATLLEYHKGDRCMAASMAVLANQFQVIQTRSQLLLSLAALVLTITGFSGPKIASTNMATRALMICGIVLDVVSIGVLLIQSLKVRWSTQIRGASDLETLELIILNRNKKTTHYFAALVLLVLALASYISSVALFLFYFPAA